MPAKSESGLTGHRPEFVRETVDSNGDPQTPSDPDFLRYSDNIRSFEWSGSPELEAQRGLSDVDPNQHFKAPETHSLTVTYDLQRWFSGSTNDAAYDGLQRDADGYLPNTHTVVDREEKSSIAANSTVNGSTQKDTRIFTVARGAAMDSVTVTGDPGSQQPIIVEATYEAEKVRSYQIDQPGSSTELDVVSSDASDTTQTVTIEDEDAGTSADVSLNGTTTVTTTGTSFADIDSVSIDAETVGDVTISETGGDDLCVIRGSDYYDGIEGDLGVPALGSGSHESALGSAYEHFLGDTITYSGSAMAMDVNSFELSVSNNTERNMREDSVAQRILHGTRDTEVTGTLFGENISHERADEAFGNVAADIVWTMTGGTLTISDAVVTDTGGRTYEAETAAFIPDCTFTGEGVTIA